jgi:hypothetical protein
MLSSKGSVGTCIPKVLRHSYIALSRRTDNGHYVAHTLHACMRGDGHQRPACTTTPHEVNIVAVRGHASPLRSSTTSGLDVYILEAERNLR